MGKEELDKMQQIDIRSVDRKELVDIRTLDFQSVENEDTDTKIRYFVKNIKNPYCFMVDNVVVKSSFTEGESLKQRLQEFVDGL